jgi:hypothetical protein
MRVHNATPLTMYCIGKGYEFQGTYFHTPRLLQVLELTDAGINGTPLENTEYHEPSLVVGRCPKQSTC